jgi:sugar lactone lactonase YvrE
MRLWNLLSIPTLVVLSTMGCNGALPGGQSGSDLSCFPGEVGDADCASEFGDGWVCERTEQICVQAATPRCAVDFCSPEIVAEGQSGANGVALDDSHVYWTTSFSDGDAVMRRNKSGGELQVLADNQKGASELVLDATHVYWIANEAGDVMRIAKSGGEAQTLAQGQVGLNGIEVDESHVYFMTGNGGTDAVVRVGKDGGFATLVAQSSNPWGVAIDADYVYWNDPGSSRVVRQAKDGGSLEDLAVDERGAMQIAVDADGIYWVSISELVVRHSRGPGEPVETVATFESLDENISWVGGISLDATHIYWTAYPANVVMRVSKDGGAPEILAAQQSYPLGVAVDDDYVYWASSSDNTIMRLSRCACDL